MSTSDFMCAKAHGIVVQYKKYKGGTYNMDIAGVSMALSNISVQSEIGTAVLSKAMDTNEQLGAGMVQMIDSAAMERSVNPNVGANFDMSI